MPNYDLGTAHGRIKVDADTRGASNAEKALKSFERVIGALAGKLGNFESSMNKIEAELRAAKNDFEKAERAADGFDRSVSGADKSVREFNIDVLELRKRMKGIQNVSEQITPPLINAIKVMREFRALGNESFSNSPIIRWSRAVHRAGGTAAVISAITGRFVGLGAAMKTVTGHQASVLRFASSFRTFSFVAGVLGTFAVKSGLAAKAVSVLTNGMAPLDYALRGVYSRLNTLTPRIKGFGASLKDVWRNMDRTAMGAVQLIGGLALVRSGINGLRRQFAFLTQIPPLIKAAIGAGLYLLPAALQLGGKALQGFSNLLVGLLDGVKQLSGGLLAIPGGISLMVAAFGSLKVITAGLKTLFSDVFKAKDATEMAAALEHLPPAMRGIGQALADVLPKWKALSTDAAMTFAAGAEEQIRKLSEGLLPVLNKGLQQNASAWRGAKDQVVDFVKQGQTLTDINALFSLSAQVINQLSGNIQPLLSGFRDLSIVGAQFLRDLSAGVPALTEKFAAWAAANRENGNLMKWMQDGWKGAKDLARGLGDAGKAAWMLLTLFKTNDGSDFLDRFAASMAKFNATVQKSAAGGVLKQIGDAVKSVGTDKISSLIDVFRSFGDALKQIIPFIVQISESFNSVMTPALKLTAEIIEQVIGFLNELGAGEKIGQILGIAAAFKLITTVLGPLRSLFQVFFGSFTAFKGAQNIVLGVAGALEKFGSAGQTASSALLGVGDAVAGAMQKMMLIGAVIGGFILALNSANDKSREFDKTMAESAQHQKEFSQSLKNAFIQDKGLAGKTVFDTVTQRVSSMRADLDKQASEMPGVMDHIKGFFLTGGGGTDLFKDNGKGGDARPTFWFSDPKYINDAQAAADAASKAEGAFKRLGFTNQDLSNIVSGSTTAFDAQVESIRNSGEGGQEAADQLQGMRTVYKGMLDDFAAAGPGGAKLAAGIEAIASAAGDSEVKLNGMKTALEGLGLLQTSQYEAAFNYAEAIKGLGDAAANSAANITDFNDILVPGTNTLNTNSAAAQQLFNVLQPLGEKFLNLASKGGNVTQMWADMQPNLEKTAAAFHLPIPVIQDLVGQMGAIPDAVNILVQLEGKDAATQGMAQILLFAQQNLGKGINIPIIVQDPKAVEAALESVFGDIADSDANSIKLKVNVDPAGLPALQNWLSQHGISMGGAPVATQNAAQLPVAVPPPPAGLPPGVGLQPSDGSRGGARPAAPAAAPPPPPQPPQPLPNIAPNPQSVQALADANKQIADLKAALEGLQNKPINIDTKGIDDIKAKVGELKAFLGENGNLEFTIIAKGYDETVAVMNRVKDSVTNLINEVNKIPGATQTAFGQVIQQLSALATQANTQGSAFVTAFAQGLNSNPAAIQAAEAMALEIRKRFHQSPPKKGPLAAHGDAAKYAGGAFVSAYATGMSGNYAVASKAASGMASMVSGAMPSGGNTPFLGQLSQFLDFFDHLNSGFQQMVDLFSNAAKFISDPLGKGTFFGQSTGAAFGFTRDRSISDADLQQRRTDNVAKSAATGGTGPGGAYAGDAAILSRVPKGRYSAEGSLEKGLGDCSSAVEDLVNIMDGAPTGGRQMSTANAAQWLADHGFQQGKGALGDMRVAFNSGHMQATLPGGTNFNWGSPGAAAAGGVGGSLGADDPALTSQWYRKVTAAAVAAVATDPNAHTGTGALPGPTDPTQQTLDTIAQNTGKTADTNDAQLSMLRQQDSTLNDAITTGQNPNSTDEQVAASLMTIQKSIDATNNNNTPQAKAQASALQGVQDSIKSDRGMTEGANPIDQITGAASAASNIASDVMGVLKSGIEAFGAANDLVQMGVRYPSNSEDIMKAIDDVQKFIEFGAKVAQTVGDIASTASSFTGGMDMGATAAVGQVASLVSGALTAVNNAIDIGQEAYRIIADNFVGPLLGMLAGGAGGALQGQVKMLLDTNSGQLYTYSQDNPQDKRGHNVPGMVAQPSYQQAVGTVNVYGGPGSDPRDNTRDMMFQVRAAQQSGALAA